MEWAEDHWKQCGWYLDCPPNRPPTFDIPLRNSIQPTLAGTEFIRVVTEPAKKTRGARKKATEEEALRNKAAEVEAARKLMEAQEVVEQKLKAAHEAEATASRKAAVLEAQLATRDAEPSRGQF